VKIGCKNHKESSDRIFGAKLSLEIIDNAKLCEEWGKCMQNVSFYGEFFVTFTKNLYFQECASRYPVKVRDCTNLPFLLLCILLVLVTVSVLTCIMKYS
jgi:hypothetical protein